MKLAYSLRFVIKSKKWGLNALGVSNNILNCRSKGLRFHQSRRLINEIHQTFQALFQKYLKLLPFIMIFRLLNLNEIAYWTMMIIIFRLQILDSNL